MRARLRYLWDQITGSYWFIPALMVVAAFLLSAGSLWIDARLKLQTILESEWLRQLLFTAGPDGAREVLSTIAGSMITVAGVVFSITIVALSLASSQFGPRVLANFMRDRGNQLVLGTFIATFLYCLLVLRTIRGEGGETEVLVPHLSVSVAIVLALASLGVLIYFIHHVSISIQAPTLVARLARDLHHSVEVLYAEETGAAATDASHGRIPDGFEEEAERVECRHNGYLDAVDVQGLMELAREHDLVIRLEYRPGQFVIRGSTLARIWPPSPPEEVLDTIRTSIVTGHRRTPLQDVEFPIDQLVEVAVRALSPGINDPFTAIACIDHLAGGLCHLAQRTFPSAHRVDAEGRLRLVMARPTRFQGVLDAALHGIRQNASYHAGVYIRMLEALERVTGCVRTADQLDPLLHHAQMILRAAAEQVRQEEDLADVQDRYRALERAAERVRRSL